MRRKTETGKIWLEICNNCKSHEEIFAGAISAKREGTLSYIQKSDNISDKFSLAILSGDVEAIKELYKSTILTDYQKKLIKELQERNNELLLTLNPCV